MTNFPSIERRISLTSIMIMVSQIAVVVGYTCVPQYNLSLRDRQRYDGWDGYYRTPDLEHTSLLASYLGDLSTFSEGHQQPTRTGASYKTLSTWYQRMDYRLANPHYDAYFVVDEDFYSPSDLWPSLLMASQTDVVETSEEDKSRGWSSVQALRWAVGWVLRRSWGHINVLCYIN